MNEVLIAQKWIHQKLSSNVTLMSQITGGIHDEIAPSTASYPLIVLKNKKGQGDVRTFNRKHKVMTNVSFLIEVVAKTESVFQEIANGYNLSDLFTLLDNSLDIKNNENVTGGGILLSCVRSEPTKRKEPYNGINYYYLGADYDLQVKN